MLSGYFGLLACESPHRLALPNHYRTGDDIKKFPQCGAIVYAQIILNDNLKIVNFNVCNTKSVTQSVTATLWSLEVQFHKW